MSPKPVTPRLVASALVAACTARGVDPDQAFVEGKPGNRRARILAGAALLEFGVGPREEVCEKLWIESNDLKPSRRGRHEVSDGLLAQVLRELSGMGQVPDVVPSNEGTGWNANRTALLKRRFAQGWSASQIARELGGVTRNAVVGKCSRMGLSRSEACRKVTGSLATRQLAKPLPAAKVKPAKAAKASPPKPKAEARPPRLVVIQGVPEPELPPVVHADTPAAVLALEANHCRWPIGEPSQAGFSFCCRPAQWISEDKRDTYCQAHRKIAGGGSVVSDKEYARSLRRWA